MYNKNIHTCKQTLFRLIAAFPAVNVRRILEALRRDCEPSYPITEPLKLEAPSPRTVTNNLLKSSLK